MAFIKIDNLGKTGVNKDLSEHELPENSWTDSNNVRFLDGLAHQFLGHGSVYGPLTAIPQHVLPCFVGGDNYWIYTAASKIFAVTSSIGVVATTDISHATPRPGAVNKWTSTLLSGIPVLNLDGANFVPMFWDLVLTNKFKNLTNWPAATYCKSIKSFRNFLIALNITKGATNFPYMVKWSHPADPGAVPTSWDHTDATVDAGEADIADGYDRIVDGLTLRESFMIYKESSIWRMDFTGWPNIFTFTKVLGSSGALNLNCIVETDGYHVVLTNSDVISHDGYFASSVLDKMTRRYLFKNIDADNFGLCFVFKNPFFNEIFICYPQIGSTSCDRAMVWNYKDKTIAFRDLPNINHANFGTMNIGFSESWNSDNDPWGSDITLWNGPDFVPNSARVLMCGDTTKLYALDSSSTFDGTIPTAFIERRGLSLDKPENRKIIRGVRARFSGTPSGTVIIKIGASDDPYTDPTYSAPMTYTIGETLNSDCLVDGRYIAVRIESGTAYQWRLDSFDLDVEYTGMW